MGMLVAFLVEDARLVEVVDADLPRGVEDAFGVEHHAHVDDVPFLVAEERQVAGLDLGKEIHQFALFDLLGGVTGKELASRPSAELHKSAAVDAEEGAAAPKVRCPEHLLCEVEHHRRGEGLRYGGGEVVRLIQQRADGEVLPLMIEDGPVDDMPPLAFQCQVVLVADGMVLDALDPSLVVVDLGSDEVPSRLLVEFLVEFVVEQLAHHLAGMARLFPKGNDR